MKKTVFFSILWVILLCAFVLQVRDVFAALSIPIAPRWVVLAPTMATFAAFFVLTLRKAGLTFEARAGKAEANLKSLQAEVSPL